MSSPLGRAGAALCGFTAAVFLAGAVSQEDAGPPQDFFSPSGGGRGEARAALTTARPSAAAPRAGGPRAADPVDLATGLFIHTRDDLAIADVIPIALTWTYQSSETAAGPMGMGMHDGYSPWIKKMGIGQWVIVLPDGTREPFHDNFVRDSQGLVSVQCLSVGGRFHGATLTRIVNPAYPQPKQYKVAFADGSAWLFDRQAPAPLVEVDDASGHAVKLQWRNAQGEDYYAQPPRRAMQQYLSRITSPSGHWISLSYGAVPNVASPMLLSAPDDAGREVDYTYKTFAPGGPAYLETVTPRDAPGRPPPAPLVYAWYAESTPIRFKSLTDARGQVVLTNHYDPIGRVVRQDLAPEPHKKGLPAWIFEYTGGQALGDIATQVTTTDPDGVKTIYTFGPDGQVTHKAQVHDAGLWRDAPPQAATTPPSRGDVS